MNGRLGSLLILIAACLATGCGTVMNLRGDNPLLVVWDTPKPYGGVELDTKLGLHCLQIWFGIIEAFGRDDIPGGLSGVAEEVASLVREDGITMAGLTVVGAYLLFVDRPWSLLGDTLTLPYTSRPGMFMRLRPQPLPPP